MAQIEWQRCLGTPSSTWGTSPNAVVETADGGFVVVAKAFGNGGDITGWHTGFSGTGSPMADIWVAKLSSTGALEWQRACGGSSWEEGTGIAQCPDGGYIVSGITSSTNGDATGYHGSIDLWVLKLSADGDLLWQRVLGGTGGEYVVFLDADVPWSSFLAPTSSGGCVVGCTSSSEDGDVLGNHGLTDIWVAQVSADGELEWQRCLGGSADDSFHCVKVDEADNVMVVGGVRSEDGDVEGHHGNSDLFIAKLSSAGELLWANTLGGSGEEHDYDLILTGDGGCIAAGNTTSPDGDVSGFHGNADVWVVKLDAAGELEWQRACGGSYGQSFAKVRTAPDGGYYMATMTAANDGDVSGYHGPPESSLYDIWVVRLSTDGELLWQRCLGGTSDDHLRSVIPMPNGGCTILGTAFSTDGDVEGCPGPLDGWVVRLDNEGAVAWQDCLGSTFSDNHLGLFLTTDGGYVHWAMVTEGDGDVDPAQFHGFADTWVVKLLVDDHTALVDAPASHFSVAPVPATHSVRITVEPALGADGFVITDAMGRAVRSGPLTNGSLVLDVHAWPRGLYTVTLHHSASTTSRRLILE